MMGERSDGGPAFPYTARDTNMYGEPMYQNWDGMSLRDWLAGQALVGLLAQGKSHGEAAALAYLTADFVLANQ